MIRILQVPQNFAKRLGSCESTPEHTGGSERLDLGKSEVLYYIYIYSAISKTEGLHEGVPTVADEEEVLAFLLQSLQQHFGLLDLLQVHICP